MVGDPTNIEVVSFDWDEANIEHIGRHGLVPRDVEAALTNRPLFFENVPGRSATHIMVGRDVNGRVLYVPLIHTEVLGVWRVITAWESRFARRLSSTQGEENEEL